MVTIDPARLRFWRNMRTMTVTELAEASRINRHSLISYELGRRMPREKPFRRLCTALGIGPENLLLDGYRYIPQAKNDEEFSDGPVELD